jgi:hypothetical protein
MASTGLHPQVDVKMEEVFRQIEDGKYWPTPDKELAPNVFVSEVWPEPPPRNHIQIFVSFPGVKGIPTRVLEGECFMRLFVLAQDI